MARVPPVVLSLVALVAGAFHGACDGEDGPRARRKRGPVPVAVAPVVTGAIELQRTFMGTVRARRRFAVSAHVAGRVQKLLVDLGDTVERGQVVVELDDREDVQGVSQASADRSVAEARLAESRSALEIAKRELARIESLHGKGVVPLAELDGARSRHLAATTAVRVAQAQLSRTGAGLASARIRSGYKKVVALWADDDPARTVAQRHVSEGDRVTAGQSLVTVVDLQPIQVIIYVGEKDYAQLATGLPVVVSSEAFPGVEMTGVVKRIAPVFEELSRRAQVELELANDDGALKPGMFVRARIALERVEQTTIVPVAAVTTRAGMNGVFVVDAAGDRVHWRQVKVGIRQGERVQVTGEGVSGRVVTLGQQLIRDGSKVTFPTADDRPIENDKGPRKEQADR